MEPSATRTTPRSSAMMNDHVLQPKAAVEHGHEVSDQFLVLDFCGGLTWILAISFSECASMLHDEIHKLISVTCKLLGRLLSWAQHFHNQLLVDNVLEDCQHTSIVGASSHQTCHAVEHVLQILPCQTSAANFNDEVVGVIAKNATRREVVLESDIRGRE